MTDSPSITAYSTALFSTWYFVDTYGILFDCGDGVCAGLLQKARKIKHVFVSHADRDHVSGLLQFQQLNGRPDLTIHYPADSGSFSHFADFTRKFDPHVSGTRWSPIRPNQEIHIRENLIVRPIENRHVVTDGNQIKSLSYVVESIHRKLKPEFTGMPSQEIAKLRTVLGADGITNETRVVEMIYSGDTPIELDGRYDNARILIHEATFLTADEIEPDNPKRNKHSSLDAVMRMVAGSHIEHLVLGHFSSRYSNAQIDEAIEREVKRNEIKIPVQPIYPGEIVRKSRTQ